MKKADELWEKYGNKFADIAVNQTVRVAQRVEFLAALNEYGEAVRAEAVKVCKTVVCDCDMSDRHDCVVHDCAAAIEKMKLPSNEAPPNEIDPNKWAFDRGLESY